MFEEIVEEDLSMKSSILSTHLQILVSRDLEELKKLFLEEVKNLNNHNHYYREVWFYKLFSLKAEFRLYADLIGSLTMIDRSSFRNCVNDLDCETALEGVQRDVLLKILDFYDNHSADDIEKFNYIYRSTEDINVVLREDNFDLFFNSRIFSLFDKETLCHLYREMMPQFQSSLCHLYREKMPQFQSSLRYNIFINFLKKENHKMLYMMSIMAMKLKDRSGHNNEFFEHWFSCMGSTTFIKLLNSMYDYYVKEKGNEEVFKNKYLTSNEYLDIDEFIRVVFEKTDMYLYPERDQFYEKVLNDRRRFHEGFFKKGGLEKVIDGSFDESYFSIIDDKDKLNYLKEAFFRNIYGIGYDDVVYLVNSYGDLDLLEKDIMEKDRDIYNVLRAFHNICGIEVDDQEKIRTLQEKYYEYISQNGLDYVKNNNSYFILESLFNRMIINTYNRKLLQVDKLAVIGEFKGVKLLDSGLDFNIILSSLGGVGELYEGNKDIKNKWNSSVSASNHGLSCSHINNENLGVINLRSVLLGFSYIPEYSLNKMGTTDIFSKKEYYDLRSKKAYSKDVPNKYFSASVLPNESRYGYNELLIDRFLMDDKDNLLKLQPDYVVYYQTSDDYFENRYFEKAMRVAKHFEMPIVVVDVRKIKENERQILIGKEEELFSSSKCNSTLMREIVVRYMNNHTGSLTLVGDNFYKEDFAVEGLERFFNRFFENVANLDSDIQKEWCNALLDIYSEEERKHKMANGVQNYGYSVQEFILDNYDVKDRILKSGMVESYSFSFNEYFFNTNKRTIVNFINRLDTMHRFDFKLDSELVEMDCIIPEDEDIGLIDNLLISYFFENGFSLPLDSLIEKKFKGSVVFSCEGDFDLVLETGDNIFSDYDYVWNRRNGRAIDESKLNIVLDKLDNISNKEFLNIFGETINEYVSMTGKRFEDVGCNLLDKKKNVRNEFNRLMRSLSYDSGNPKK